MIQEQQRLADELALLQQGILDDSDDDDDDADDDNETDKSNPTLDIINNIPTTPSNEIISFTNNDFNNINNNYNNTITSSKFGLYQYKTIQHEDLLEVKLPWMETGYAWTSLAPEYYDMLKKKINNKNYTI